MLGYDSIFKSLVPSILDQKIRLFISDIFIPGMVIFLKYKNLSVPPAKEEIEYIFKDLFDQFKDSLKSSEVPVYEEYSMASLIARNPDYNFLTSDVKTTLLKSEESLKIVFNDTLGDIFKLKNVANGPPSPENSFSILLDPGTGLSSDQIIPEISVYGYFKKILNDYNKEVASAGRPHKNENEKLDKMLLKLINFDEET